MIPFIIQTNKRLFRHYEGFAFFIFIFYWKGTQQKEVIINHERIHFYQQVELLFILHWILYSAFYLIGRVKGKDHDTAYMQNPFEREAYLFEKDLTYCKHRKPFRWIYLA